MMNASANAAPTPNDIFRVELNLRVGDTRAISFVGCPPRIASYDGSLVKLPKGQPSIVSYYFEALIVPGCEIFLCRSDVKLHQFLNDYASDSRTIMVSSHPPSGAFAEDIKCMYKFDLPPDNKQLGIDFEGFPPKLTTVDSSSPFYGKATPGLIVEALLLPDGTHMNSFQPDFSAATLRTKLDDTQGFSGRQLVLKDLKEAETKKTVERKGDNFVGEEKDPTDANHGRGCCCM